MLITKLSHCQTICHGKTFHVLALPYRQLSRNDGMLAWLKSASTKTILIPCNLTKVIMRTAYGKVFINNSLAVMPFEVPWLMSVSF